MLTISPFGTTIWLTVAFCADAGPAETIERQSVSTSSLHEIMDVAFRG
jgi:hypothetical protein